MSAQCEDRTVKCGKKNKVTTECDKSTVICDVGIVQCDNKIFKYEKKIMVPPSATKVRSNMILILPNVTVEPIKCVKKIRDSWMWKKYNHI